MTAADSPSYTAEDHGYGLAFVVFSSVFGSVLGPIVGGFIEQYASWIRFLVREAADAQFTGGSSGRSKWTSLASPLTSRLAFGGGVQLLHLFTVPECARPPSRL